MMLAMVLDHPGGADTFRPEERPIPEATATHSVLEVMAFGVNHADLITRAGGSPDVRFPRVIGIEAVGRVHATSPASGLEVGQRVVTLMGGVGREFDGSYQEYALVPNSQLYPVGIEMAWNRLATIPESFYTALGSLDRMHLTAGDALLIRGGTSSVGLAAMQLAKSFGVRVTSTTRSPGKIARLEALGADEVLVDAGTLPGTERFDGVLELVGAATLDDSMGHAAPRGCVVVTGGLGGQWTVPDFDPFSIRGYLTNFQSTEVNPALLRHMLTLVAQQGLSLPIVGEFPLPDVGRAHEALETSTEMGKIVVSVAH